MTVWIKQGVEGTLSNQAQKARGKVADLYESKGYDLYITSIEEGNHSNRSLHYNKNAFDIRYASRVPFAEIKTLLGSDFDVIPEVDHIHIEYDPKP